MMSRQRRRIGQRRRRPSAPRILLRQGAGVTAWLVFAAFTLAAWMALTRPAPPRFTSPKPDALSREQARAINAATPFAPGPVEAAKAFRFRGTPAGREQAIRCLATVALYEAGSDDSGQRAVMQVVLNRVRSRSFPKTICGVVYDGAYLPTGCQFSFACDGSVTRRPERQGWLAARRNARLALGGRVFAPVGTATHYHTDWVVPYWSASLDKIARVRSHIFYRRPTSRRAS